MKMQLMTNQKGKKIAAVVPIEEYAELMEDRTCIANQRDEKALHSRRS